MKDTNAVITDKSIHIHKDTSGSVYEKDTKAYHEIIGWVIENKKEFKTFEDRR